MTINSDQRLRLTLRQLEVFAATVRSGSTRGAADKVARSQSAASAALADLEATLGAVLFDRVGRRLVLNQNGKALLPRAVALLERAAEAEACLRVELEAPLRIASSMTVGEYMLPQLIAGWHQDHPHGRVRLDVVNTQEVLRAVAAYDADVGFIEGTGSHPDLVVSRCVATNWYRSLRPIMRLRVATQPSSSLRTPLGCCASRGRAHAKCRTGG